MKSTKSRITSLLIAVLMIAGIGFIEKGSAADVSLKVTVNVSASVSIGTSAYSFGTLAANETKISTGAIPVTNNSSGLTEDYEIDGSNTANWTAHASTNTGTNNFNLRALISTSAVTAPVYGNFAQTNTGLTEGTSLEDMTNAAFGLFTDGSGDEVPSSGARSTQYLWFRLIAPAEITAGNGTEQSITVTLTASDNAF